MTADADTLRKCAFTSNFMDHYPIDPYQCRGRAILALNTTESITGRLV
jgi:hypothetical protein